MQQDINVIHPVLTRTDSDSDDGGSGPPRLIFRVVPVLIIVVMVLAPHPSLLLILVFFYLRGLGSPALFATHLAVTYALTFMIFCSLIICIARDPGPVTLNEGGRDGAEDGDEDVDLTEALMPPADYSTDGARWCRKCWAPKPERAHHCSVCGRCVLKMDHHCPWMAHKCIGHRTYPAFIHFLACITLLAIYLGAISMTVVWFAFTHAGAVEENIAVHSLFLSFAGIVFTMVIGSFLLYHIYLVTTNQTTLESLHPFQLLRHLPPIPEGSTSRPLSDPPEEHQLSFNQRSIVKDAHRYIRLYDVGWKQNWAQVFGWKTRWGLARRLICGGASQGDGKTFPRNYGADELLARLASEIVGADKAL